MIKSTRYSQEEIIQNIIELHLDGKDIEVDPTYSTGNFYKKTKIDRPVFSSDLFPQDDITIQADARNLPLESGSINSVMFDPPFVVGYGPSIEKSKGRV